MSKEAYVNHINSTMGWNESTLKLQVSEVVRNDFYKSLLKCGSTAAMGKWIQKPQPSFNVAYSKETLTELFAMDKLEAIIDLGKDDVVGYLTKPSKKEFLNHTRPSYLYSFILSYGELSI